MNIFCDNWNEIYFHITKSNATDRPGKTGKQKSIFYGTLSNKVPELLARAKGPMRIPGEVGSIRLLKCSWVRFRSEGIEFGVAPGLRLLRNVTGMVK